MADADFLIEIIARLRDEASPGIEALKAKINSMKASQDAENAEKDLGRAIEDTGRKTDEAKRKRDLYTRATQDTASIARDSENAVRREAEAHDRASASVSGHVTEQEKFAIALADVKRKQEDAASGADKLRARTSALHTTWNSFESDLNNGKFSKGEAARGLKEFSSEFSSLSRKLETGGQDWKDTEAVLDRIGKKLKNPDLASTGGLGNALKRGNVGEALDAIDAKVGDVGIRISGVASALQGFFDLMKIGFSQQIITGIVSLAGSLFSLASAATQAGAALAGAFISGLGQAIPMLSIVAAAAERFKSILQAVSITSKAEEQKYYNPNEKQVAQLQNASQLISSQQQLSNSYIQLYEAQQRVRDSQIALTEARYTASRQAKELTLDEKNARLEAEGANLSLAESRRQLQIATRSGDTAGLAQAELAVKEAEVSKEKAQYAVPKAEREARLARQRGVSGAPAVISATEGAEGARVAVLQAKQAGEAAQRQEKITRLQQASRSTHETSSEAQLSFLKKGMSKTEIGLYNALVEIEKELKSPDSPLKKITDYFVEPFTNAVERIRSLLKNNAFLGPIDELAESMGKGLKSLEKFTFGSQGTNFFETMAKDASKNIPIVTSAIEGIMKLFEDIAKAANPAFHKLSEDWDNFWNKLDRKYEGTGLNRLESFFNKSVEYAESFGRLTSALGGLFKAIGTDAAPQGKSTVEGLTGSIKEATSWVQSHGPEVRKFFSESKEGFAIVGQMIFAIGVSLIKVFSLSSLTAFNGFLQQILLPGLRNVVTVLGFIVTKTLDFFNFFGRTGIVVLEVIGTIIALGIAFSKIIIIIKDIITFIGEIKAALIAMDWEAILLSPWVAVGALITGVVALLGGFDSAQKKNKVSTEEVNQALERQAEALRTIKSLNDEFKSSKLGVEEAKIQVSSSEQNLAKAKKESLQTGETSAERNLRIKQDEQQVERSKLSYSERQKEFSQLPDKQKETVTRESKVNEEALKDARNHNKRTTEEVNSLENKKNKIESFVKPSERGEDPYLIEIDTKLIAKKKELAESQEKLGKATKEGGEISKKSNEVISLSSETTAKSAPKLSAAYAEAYKKFEESVHNGAKSAKTGMVTIRELVDKSLKKYGVTPAEISGAASGASSALHGASKIAGNISGALPRLAAGAYVPARSGGAVANIAEAGHDEVVLSTDPAHASRSKTLLGRYFRAAPHMAAGGFVADPGTNFTVNQEPKIVTELKKLGEYLNTTIYGISGYRSPSHSVEVGGFSDDPHTRGEAADIGVGSNTLASASRLTAGLLAKFDLYRPFYPASAHEINHIQLIPGTEGGITGSIGSSGVSGSSSVSKFSIPNIKAPKIKGGGAIGAVSQAALNIATKAANIYLSKQSGSGLISGVVGKLGGGNVEKQIMRFFTSSGLSKIAASGIAGNVGQESSFDPNAPGGGLFQDIGGRGAGQGASVFAQLKTALRELRGSYRSVLARLMGAKSPQEAARIFSEGFERPGIPDIGNREHYATEAYASYAQGGRAPWGGRPVPIIAHEGERIMNPAQYGETARLAGTSPGGLDRHLGYDSSPRQSFAVGGIPTVSRQFSQKSSGSEPASVLMNIFNEFSNFNPILSDPGSIGSIEKIAKIFKLIAEGFKKLKVVNKNNEKYANEMGEFVSNIVEESNGILAKLKEGREVIKSKLSSKKTEAGFSGVKERSSRGVKIRLSGEGLSVLEKQKIIKLGSGGQSAMEAAEVKALAQEGKELSKESNLISSAMAKVKSGLASAGKIKNSGKRKTAIIKLTGDYDSLIKQQKELSESMSTNIEARYQAESQRIQNEITELNTAYQTISQELTSSATQATSMGNLGAVGGIEVQIRQSAEKQIGSLTSKLKSAESIGDTELVDSIKQELISLYETINNSVVEQLNAAETLIQRENQQVSTSLGVSQTRAQTFGNLSELPGIDEAIANNAKNGISQLQKLLIESENDHDTAKSVEIKEAIAALEDTVVSATAAKINDSLSLIQREAGLSESKTGMLSSLSKTAAARGEFGRAGSLEKESLENKQTSLLSTRAAEEQLIAQAAQEGDTAAVITLTEELYKNTSELEENNLALKENAVINRELIVTQIEATGQFKTGIYKAAISGLEIVGKTTGFTNVKGLLEAAKGEGTALGSERAGLEGQAKGIGLNVEGMTPAQILSYLASPEGQSKLSELEKGEDKGEKEQMYKLVQALEGNASATLQNTEKIAELNGQLNQPQSFTTAAFSQFRTAIFSGMGELSPSYQTAATALGTAEMPRYGMATPGAQSGGNTYHLNIPHPVEVLDPQLLGEQFNHAISNAPVM